MDDARLCWVSVYGGGAHLGSGRYAHISEAIEALEAQTREVATLRDLLNAKGRTFYLMSIVGEYVPETTMVKVG